jgi:hypothetical protein
MIRLRHRSWTGTDLWECAFRENTAFIAISDSSSSDISGEEQDRGCDLDHRRWRRRRRCRVGRSGVDVHEQAGLSAGTVTDNDEFASQFGHPRCFSV